MLSQMSIKACFILLFLFLKWLLKSCRKITFSKIVDFHSFSYIFFLSNQTVEYISLNENKNKLVREVIFKTFPFEINP